MRVLHINVTDGAGGAGIAARRLHQALLGEGVDSMMLVQDKHSDDPRVIGPSKTELAFTPGALRQKLDRLPLRARYGSVRTAWHVGWLPNPGLAHRIRSLDPDVVVLHWVGAGMVPNSLLRTIGRPVAWVLHDMAPITGGCHYDRGCGRFQTGCGCCPLLNSKDDNDLSRSIFLKKLLAMDHTQIVPVAISEWMAEQARRSLIFAGRPVRTIHHPLDMQRFRPRDRFEARRTLGWPLDKRVILFGAVNALQDRRKGFHHLAKALESLPHDRYSGDTQLRIMGSQKPGPDSYGGIPAVHDGPPANQDELAARFAAADIVVTPSEQEAFGLVAAEAQASGTAVLGFDHGGLRDIVEHNVTGYLAQPLDAGDLARGLRTMLDNDAVLGEMSDAARERALKLYEPSRQAAAYIGLFNEMIQAQQAARAQVRRVRLVQREVLL